MNTVACMSSDNACVPGHIGGANIRVLCITEQESLRELPTRIIARCPNLRMLDVYKCDQLSSLTGLSEPLPNLRTLSCRSCAQLTDIPDATITQVANVRRMILYGCVALNRLPDSLGSLQNLAILIVSDSAIRTLPATMGRLTSLTTLDLSNNQSLRSLPVSIGDLSTSLTTLSLTNCVSLTELPDSIGRLTALSSLSLLSCKSLETLPDSICELSNITSLNLYDCKTLRRLPATLGEMTWLQALILTRCDMLASLPDSINNLTALTRANGPYAPLPPPYHDIPTTHRDTSVHLQLEQLTCRNRQYQTLLACIIASRRRARRYRARYLPPELWHIVSDCITPESSLTSSS